MKQRIGSALLALVLLCLCACGSGQGAAPAGGSASDATAETAPVDAEGTIGRLLAGEEAFLRAARRAVARAYDSMWHDRPIDYEQVQGYYRGVDAQVADSGLVQRARALAAVQPDPARLRQEDDGRILYLAALPQDGEMAEQWVALELDPDRPAGPSKTETDHIVTATLEDGRVTLCFDGSSEAARLLRGMDYTAQREFPMPGDTLPLGPDHTYEVQGLFSDYTDMILLDPGDADTYLPYLFLVTADGGLEVVDILRCFQYSGSFFAMPLPGRFDSDEPVRLDASQYGGRRLIATGSEGGQYELTSVLETARTAAPEGAWSGAMEEIAVEGGSYYRVANLDVYSKELEAYGYFNVTELDMLDESTVGDEVHITTLGMAGDGIVSAMQWRTPDGLTYQTAAWVTGTEEYGDGYAETLRFKPLAGDSPLVFDGEQGTLTLHRSEFGPAGAVNELVEDFKGEWVDENSGRCSLRVSPSGRVEVVDITVTWAQSADETYIWTMSAAPGLFEPAFYYYDGECRVVSYGEDGAETAEEVLYSDSCGCFTLTDRGAVTWGDINFEQSESCRFVPDGPVG